jgi:hypothetical protein
MWRRPSRCVHLMPWRHSDLPRQVAFNCLDVGVRLRLEAPSERAASLRLPLQLAIFFVIGTLGSSTAEVARRRSNPPPGGASDSPRGGMVPWQRGTVGRSTGA